MDQHTPRAAPCLLLALLLGALLLGPTACAPAASESTASESPTQHTYTVRGMIRQLPDEKDPAKQLLIQHEAIVDWVNEDGYETGMPGMTMPFPPAPGVDLSPFAPGDWVEFTFRVDWNQAPRMRLTAISPLRDADAGTPESH